MSDNSIANFLGVGKDTNKYSTSANNLGNGPRTQKEEKNNPDINRVNNRANTGRSERLTAELFIVGMPHIKARKCITMTNVGDWDGEWYVKSVIHQWSPEKGYTTRLSLLREVS